MNSRIKNVFLNTQLWHAGRILAAVLALAGWLAAPALARQSGAGQAAGTSSSSQSSDDNTAPAGLDFGNYHATSTIELGWRYSNITGSQQNYDTFVNMQEGPRLLNVGLNLRSLNHDGALFDDLSLTGFGFGGDPNDVVRLRMSKNKWYNFNASYRRDKYFWDYNLLANPLNSTGVFPPYTINYSPHALDLSRRMTDLNLTLLPQSRVRVRLGYNHELLAGPSLSTLHVGTEPALYQDWKNTTDNYRAGVDFMLLPRTTLSYDQFVEHFKQDTTYADVPLNLFFQQNNYAFQLANGVPVDLGISAGPCGSPIVNPNTTPPTANPTCNAYLSYSRGGRPRATIPTERFSFQSTYFHNFTTTGQISYSSANNAMADYSELFTGYESRTAARGSNSGGKTDSKRVLVNADWAGVLQVTSKFRISDTFAFNTYRLPGYYDFLNAYVFAQAPQSGQSGMLLPPATFNATNCPPPFTAVTCPQHGSGSEADLALGTNSNYLGQGIRTNTFELQYDFTPKIGASIGYRYLNRKIYDFASTFYGAETYYPGGNTNPAKAAALAARGDCALPSGVTTIPASFAVYNSDGSQRGTCTLQPDGSLVFNGFALDVDTEHNLAADINGHSALFGLWVRPAANFRTSFNLELFSADHSYTRITPRLLRHYQINSSYTPVHMVELTGAVDFLDSSDNVIEVQDKEHNRSYSLSTILTPNSRFSFDLSYNYNDIFSQGFDCFVASGSLYSGAITNPCVLSGAPYLGALSIYQSKSHFASFDVMVQPVKPVTFTAGFSGSFVHGTSQYIDPSSLLTTAFLYNNTPYGPLRFNYLLPYMTVRWNLYKGWSYIASWNYYGYNSRGPADPLTLTPLGTQDFNGNNMTLSVRYSF